MTTPDPMDQPEEDAYDLVMPFVCVTSAGGPYNDEAFTAGVQLGRITQALQAASAFGVRRMEPITVKSTLAKQLELAGMAYGFPVVTVDESEEWPEWSHVTFATSAEGIL